MPKSITVYTCSNCDAQYPKWAGRCNTCGKFGTISTESITISNQKNSTASYSTSPATVVSLGNSSATATPKLSTGLNELDRVLGGGITPGGVILLTGEPGAGKSTLVLALAEKLQQTVLYASGEEAATQVSDRLKRLGLVGKNLHFTAEAEIGAITSAARDLKPILLVIDSLQTMHNSESEATAGSPTQVRAVLSALIEFAKSNQVAVMVIGHITKAGEAAGPKAVEHLVDVVLSLEGERSGVLRILRAEKNRFGSTDEVGVFKMEENGLQEVANPSSLFLAERHAGAGAVVTCLMQGSRGLLLEVQALVSHSRQNYPKRSATGFDYKRLEVLLAVLGERAGVKLNWSDVYVNLVGGLKSREPALDLAVCLAVASAYLKKSISRQVVIFGEVGLGGEVRPVNAIDKRLNEAARLGFTEAVLPPLGEGAKVPKGIMIVEVHNLAEAVEWMR